jgi:hypothetical protein
LRIMLPGDTPNLTVLKRDFQTKVRLLGRHGFDAGIRDAEARKPSKALGGSRIRPSPELKSDRATR